MARIGNWVSTWERELREGDYSSGVVVYALRNGIVTPAECAALAADDGTVAPRDLVARIRAHDVESRFIDRWAAHREDLAAAADRIDGVDLTPYVEGMTDVLQYHLASRGRK